MRSCLLASVWWAGTTHTPPSTQTRQCGTSVHRTSFRYNWTSCRSLFRWTRGLSLCFFIGPELFLTWGGSFHRDDSEPIWPSQSVPSLPNHLFVGKRKPRLVKPPEYVKTVTITRGSELRKSWWKKIHMTLRIAVRGLFWGSCVSAPLQRCPTGSTSCHQTTFQTGSRPWRGLSGSFRSTFDLPGECYASSGHVGKAVRSLWVIEQSLADLKQPCASPGA